MLGRPGCVDTYNLFTKFPVKSVADLKGKKALRARARSGRLACKAPVRLPSMAVCRPTTTASKPVLPMAASYDLRPACSRSNFTKSRLNTSPSVDHRRSDLRRPDHDEQGHLELPAVAYMQDIFKKLGEEYSAYAVEDTVRAESRLVPEAHGEAGCHQYPTLPGGRTAQMGERVCFRISPRNGSMRRKPRAFPHVRS